MMSPAILSHLGSDIVKLVDNEDRHESSNEFAYGLDHIINMELFALECGIFFP